MIQCRFHHWFQKSCKTCQIWVKPKNVLCSYKNGTHYPMAICKFFEIFVKIENLVLGSKITKVEKNVEIWGDVPTYFDHTPSSWYCLMYELHTMKYIILTTFRLGVLTDWWLSNASGWGPELGRRRRTSQVSSSQQWASSTQQPKGGSEQPKSSCRAESEAARPQLPPTCRLGLKYQLV